MDWHDNFLAAFQELVVWYRGTPDIGAAIIRDPRQPNSFAVITDPQLGILAASPAGLVYELSLHCPATTVLQLADAIDSAS